MGCTLMAMRNTLLLFSWAMTPEVSMAAEAPRVGEVMAVEAEVDTTDRRHTRDPASVKAVVDALGDPSTWTEAGMPRCAPHLWVRLVPPSGEGGTALSFCDSSGPGYVWVPEQGSYRLPEAVGRATYQAVRGLQLPEVGSVPPELVSQHLDRLLFTATIDPGSGETGLRSVTLATGHRLEPDAVWPDGTPVSRSFVLEAGQAAEVVKALALGGFFQRAKVYVSEARPDPGDPPAGRIVGMPEAARAPAGWVQLTVSDGAWHHTWYEQNAKAIFVHTVGRLEAAGSEAQAALAELPAQLP